MRDHVGGKGENREVVGTTQTEEGTLHVCFDGVGEGSVWVGEADAKQLVVEGVGRGEGETTVQSGEGDVALQMEGREPDFKICL
jgi:hypothetical protein